MEIGVNEMEFAVYAYSILVLDFQNLRIKTYTSKPTQHNLCTMKILIIATLLVGFLSVISASTVDKKTLIALCFISGWSSPTPLNPSLDFLQLKRAPSCGWHQFENFFEWYRYVLMFSRFISMHRFMNLIYLIIPTGNGVHHGPLNSWLLRWLSFA